MNLRWSVWAALFVGVVFGGSGCASLRSGTEREKVVDTYRSANMRVTGEVEPDSSLTAWLAPYRDTVGQRLDRVIAQSRGTFSMELPESALGNLTADMIRRSAASRLHRHIDIGITDTSLLQGIIPEGPVTAGMVYELLRTDEPITVLSLTGKQVLRIANRVAANGGGAISGIRMRIDGGRAADVLIGAELVHPDSLYEVATSASVANGVSPLLSQAKAQKRIDLDLTLREAMINYIHHRRVIFPIKDNRIRL